jgi:hypothetical protein
MLSSTAFRLSNLLRGQLGTVVDAVALPAGADFVLLDEALTPVVTRSDEIGRPLLWRVGPAGVDHGDPAVVQLSSAATLAAVRPYAPVQVRARRQGADIAISWIRRTRIGGDSWDGADVPLGEEGEAYEVEILKLGGVVRTLTTPVPAVTYAASDESADFGQPQHEVSLRVYQLSAIAGRGTPATETLAL